MTIPIQFFQVVAAAIPTLLIAVVVGAKIGTRVQNRINDSPWLRWAAVTLVLMLLALVWLGEFASLMAVMTNNPTPMEGFWGLSGVVVLLIPICFELIAAIAGKLKSSQENILAAAVILGGVVTMLVFAYYLVE